MILVILALIGVVATAAILGVRYRHSHKLSDLLAAGVCATAVVVALVLSSVMS